MLRVLGVDPGLSGGLAMMDLDGETVSAIVARDIPRFGAGTHGRVNVSMIREWVRSQAPDVAFLENSWPRPTDGAVQGFRFGRACGMIEAALVCAGITPALVAPQTWKKYFGLIKKDKEASRQLATSLCPAAASFLQSKADHGRAEAILLALYGASTIVPGYVPK